MKIAHKLRLIWVIVAVNAVLLILILFFPIKGRYESLTVQSHLMADMMTNTVRLSILSHEHIMSGSARTRKQWDTQFKNIQTTLDLILKQKISAEQKKTATYISNLLKTMHGYFEQFNQFSSPVEPSQQIMRQRLESYLLQYAQQVVEQAIGLRQKSMLEQDRVIDLSFTFIFISMGLSSAIIFLMSFWVAKRINDSLSQLLRGIKSFEQGAVNFKIQFANRDEFSDVANAFNRMATSLHGSQNELHQKIVFLNVLIDTIPNPLFFRDRNGKFLGCNTAFETFFNKTKKQIIGQTIFDLVPKDIARETHNKDEELFKTGKAESYERTLTDSRNVDHDVICSKAVYHDADGNIDGLIGVFIDISERKAFEAQVSDLLSMNQGIVHSSPIGISAYDQDGNCILANPAMSKIIGGSRSALLAQNFHRIDSWKKTKLYDTALLVLADGENRELRFESVTSFGQPVVLSCIFGRFFTKKQPNLLLLAEEITKKVLFEKAIKEKNTLLEKSNQDLHDFAYIASHDLQEPLRKIVAFGDLLAEEESEHLGEDGKDYLTRMQNGAKRLQSFIDDLLAYSRVSTKAKPPALVDLNDVLTQTLSDLELAIKESHATINTADLPKIEAEPLHMHQLFQNLIGNSLKYRHADRAPCIDVSWRPLENRFIELTITDNGIGFEPEYGQKIFKPFQRLHGRGEYSGTGIGLAVCIKIAMHHQGRIDAQGLPGKGAVFTVTLPKTQTEKE